MAVFRSVPTLVAPVPQLVVGAVRQTCSACKTLARVVPLGCTFRY